MKTWKIKIKMYYCGNLVMTRTCLNSERKWVIFMCKESLMSSGYIGEYLSHKIEKINNL